MIVFKVLSAGFLLLLTGCKVFAHAPRNDVTDLGSLGGVECAANALNNKGQIVGGADTSKHGKAPGLSPTCLVKQADSFRHWLNKWK